MPIIYLSISFHVFYFLLLKKRGDFIIVNLIFIKTIFYIKNTIEKNLISQPNKLEEEKNIWLFILHLVNTISRMVENKSFGTKKP